MTDLPAPPVPAVADLDQMAKRDGFAYWTAMRNHFIAAHGLPVVGVLITWGDTFQPAAAS